MKLRFTLIAFSALLLIGNRVSAQAWGYSGIGHWTYDMDVANDGSVWSVGYGGVDPGWLDVSANWVGKTDNNGDEIFGLHISAPGASYVSNYGVMAQEDGGAIVYSATDLGKCLITRLDNTGTVLWASDYIVPNYLYGGIATCLTDGRTIVGGLRDFEYEFYEFSTSGTLLSSFTLPVDTGAVWMWSYFEYKECGITATDDGGFAFAGGAHGKRLLLKFDSDLNLEWTGAYPWAIDWEYGTQNNLKTTADGGYLLAGSASDLIYHGTVRKIDSEGNEIWFTMYNHGLSLEEGGWAAELGSGDIVVFTQDAGDQSSHIWLTDADGNEYGSIYIPVMDAIGGYSENGIEVWDVESAADGGFYVAGRLWLENFDQRHFVIKSNPDGTLGDCIFDCVWPGDANNDGYATATDLFEIGINYGATGADRDDMGIDWNAKLAQAWMEPDTMYWYIFNDLKYTDCNGNGTINDDDTTAVVNNLGLDHPLNPARMEAGDVPLYLDPVDDYLHIGVNEIPIMLGDDVTTVDAIYGIAFTISVDGENIDASALKINWDDNWMGNIGESLSFSKTFGDTKQVVGGFVRKTRTNVGGDGQIGTLQIVVVDNISGKMDLSEVEISFTDVSATLLNRDVITVAPETLTISAEDNASVSTTDLNTLYAYPNPVTDNMYFNFDENLTPEQIRIISITGDELLVLNNIGDIAKGINVSKLAAGTYIVEYNFGSNIATEQFVKQ